jgi:hypothetical protein
MARSSTVAAIILGVSAGIALLKFFNMPKEERDEFISNLKRRTDELLNDAEETIEKVERFMDEIKLKGEDEWVEKLLVVKRMMKELYGNENYYLL